ncbi:MAG: hypothetical protein IID16_12495, partial [Candidatus Marinimicrobia bacterium]|nr:hypothetical protein [Candidatus Neomarinimicrobiota bacterium]
GREGLYPINGRAESVKRLPCLPPVCRLSAEAPAQAGSTSAGRKAPAQAGSTSAGRKRQQRQADGELVKCESRVCLLP